MDNITLHLSPQMVQAICQHIDATMVHRNARPILDTISMQVNEQHNRAEPPDVPEEELPSEDEKKK